MIFRTLKDLGDISGKRVLVRVDWNVPVEEGKILDDFRIKQSLPTLEFLIKAGAHVLIATHFEGEMPRELLQSFVPSGAELLDNLRSDPGEMANSEKFAAALASKADIYINEAFSASHRSHASIVGVPRLLPSFAGLRFAEEVDNLLKAFNPPHPFLLILGGAKFETKLPLVKKFLSIADKIFIAGANAKPAFDMGLGNEKKISFPHGDIAALDADDETLQDWQEQIPNYKFILWNGPLGKYEDGYTEGTKKLAEMLANSGKEVIVGGADTLATIRELNIENKFAFISTGGGAMLDFLATGTLPGIEALS